MEPREVKDFYFLGLRRHRLFSTAPERAQLGATQLNRWLAVSSRFGLIFTLNPEGELMVVKSAVVQQNVATRDNRQLEVADFERRVLARPSAAPPYALEMSCDGLTLAVCVQKAGFPFIQLYDVRAVAAEANELSPFTEVRLSAAPGATVRDCRWNPAAPDVLAACATDGTVQVLQLPLDAVAKFVVVGSQTFSGGSMPRCLCWSPKGKQLVIGRMDGSLAQFKPDLTVAKLIPSPSADAVGLQGAPSCVDVQWLATSQFAVVFAAASNSRAVTLSVCTLEKGVPPAWNNLDDVCFGFADGRSPLEARYSMLHLAQWRLFVCASTCACETAVIGAPAGGSPTAWTSWSVDDTRRAELPLSDGRETFPLGVAVDLSATLSVQIDDHTSVPPAPVLLLLTTSGLLMPFHVVQLDASLAAVQLTAPPEQLTSAGARLGKPVAVKPVADTFSTAATVPLQSLSNSAAVPAAATKPAALLLKNRIAARVAALPTTQSADAAQSTRPAQPLSPPVAVAPPPAVSTAAQSPKQPLTRVSIGAAGQAATAQAEKAAAAVAAERQAAELKRRRRLWEKIRSFDAEVGAVDGQCPQISDEHLIKMRQKVVEAEQQFKQLSSKRLSDVSTRLDGVKDKLMDASLAAEAARNLLEMRRAPEYLHLMRRRPLDPQQERVMRQLNDLFERLRLQIAKIEQAITAEETRRMREGDGQRAWMGFAPQKAMSVAEEQLVTKTCLNIRDAIEARRRRLDELQADVARLERGSAAVTPAAANRDSADVRRAADIRALRDASFNALDDRRTADLKLIDMLNNRTPPNRVVPCVAQMKSVESKAEEIVSESASGSEQRRVEVSADSPPPSPVKPATAVVPSPAKLAEPAPAARSEAKAKVFGGFKAPSEMTFGTPLLSSTPATNKLLTQTAPRQSPVSPATTSVWSGADDTRPTITPSLLRSTVEAPPAVSAFSFGASPPPPPPPPTTKPQETSMRFLSLSDEQPSPLLESLLRAAPTVQPDKQGETEPSTLDCNDYSALAAVPEASIPPAEDNQVEVAVAGLSDAAEAAKIVVAAAPSDDQPPPLAVVEDAAEAPAISSSVDVVEVAEKEVEFKAPMPPTTLVKSPTVDSLDAMNEMDMSQESNASSTAVQTAPPPPAPVTFAFGQPASAAPALFAGSPPLPAAAQTPPAQTSIFGSPISATTAARPSVFGGAQPSTASVFGGASPASPGGQFLGGLGGQPAADAAKRNVFGGGFSFKQSSESASLFGGGAAQTQAGVFGGTPAQAPTASPQFGSQTTAFGAASGFGAPPAFGSQPAFGGGSPFKAASPSSAFGGGTSPSTFGGGFASFATQPAPTFGALASGATPPAAGGSVFGGSSVFGAAAAPPTGSTFGGQSSFSNWR